MLIFIASSNADIIQERVCLYSLLNTGHEITNIRIIDGGTGNIYGANRENILDSFEVNLSGATNFTQARMYIPLKYPGLRSVIIDPDTIVLSHLSGIFGKSPDYGIFVRKAYGIKRYATSVMGYNLPVMSEIDCNNYSDLLDNPKFTSEDKIYLSPNFVRELPWKIHRIQSKWNSFDYFNNKTSLVHLTNLRTQPWVYEGHPLQALWFDFARRALDAGYLTYEDIAMQSNVPLPYDAGRMSARPDFKECLNKNYSLSRLDKKPLAILNQFYKDIKFQGPITWLWNWLL